jgi:hypothetical protein
MMTTRPRVRVGRDVEIVQESLEGLALEGRIRLRPGRGVELLLPSPGRHGLAVRRAHVWSWEVAALGSDGPVYRGFCRWE